MSDFENKVELYKDNVVAKLRLWDKQAAAKDVMRDYLSEEGTYVKSNSKLDELLAERHKIAMTSKDEAIKLKAIDSSLAMAAGSEKVVATQNNQYNFGDFLNKLKD